MPTLRWDQIKEISFDEAKQELLTQLAGFGFTATSWQKFSVPSLLVGIGAEIMSRSSRVAVFIKGMALNETAEKEALTRFSRSHYQNFREPAVEAWRRVRLDCAAGEGPHTINVSDVVISHPEGATFRNVAGLSVAYPVTLPSGGSVTLLFEAEAAGSHANFADLELRNRGAIVTTLAGVTINSDYAERDGVDEESDERLRQRNATKWAQLGELELIRDRCVHITLKAAPAVRYVAVDDANPRGPGTFDVYCAGSSTTASVDDLAAVQSAFDARVMGQYADGTVPRGLAKAAPETTLNFLGTVYHAATYKQADVRAAVEQQAIPAFIASIPLGGFDFSPGPANVVRVVDAAAAIKSATIGDQKVVRTVQLESPADTAVPSFGKVRLGTITFSYVAVNAG